MMDYSIESVRAAFEAWCLENDGRFGLHIANGNYAAINTHNAWLGWQAALSAQPSPGGQGDARALFEEWLDTLRLDRSRHGDGYVWNDVELAWRAVEKFAARQPVGEPVSEAIEQLADDVESCVSDACGYLASDRGWDDYGIYRDDAAARYRVLPDRIRALAAPPAQQPAQVYLDGLDRALGEAIDQRDRCEEVADELADHIARITGVDIGEHSNANCPWQNAIEAAEEYKPAQAVDLERARDEGHDAAIRYVLGYLNGTGDCGSTAYDEILNACGRERIIRSAVEDGELEFTGLGRWVEMYGTAEDRALIDSQAVGK